jgi:hypothetical protein
MAQIDEEQILLRFSKLIRDTGNIADSTVVTEALRSEMETYAQGFVTEDILVEASIFTGNV